jgi:CMP/dCMP kinase
MPPKKDKSRKSTDMKFTITIDGPAAAGKGTLSKAVAAQYGLPHLDTGLLYRATAARSVTGEDPVQAAASLTPEDLARTDLRTAQIAQEASKVSAIPEVRSALTEYQKSFARRDGGAVLDGRSIAVEICPEAEVKLFVTADDTARATRRFNEMTAQGQKTTYEEVLSEMRIRDARDSGRDIVPTQAAEGALIIDTTHLTIEEAIQTAFAAIDPVFAKAAA